MEAHSRIKHAFQAGSECWCRNRRGGFGTPIAAGRKIPLTGLGAGRGAGVRAAASQRRLAISRLLLCARRCSVWSDVLWLFGHQDHPWLTALVLRCTAPSRPCSRQTADGRLGRGAWFKQACHGYQQSALHLINGSTLKPVNCGITALRRGVKPPASA